MIGYLLWQGFPLRIKRQQLTLPYAEGGLQLKNPQILGHALRLHRTLQIICAFSENFSYGLFQNVLSLIELTAPVDMNKWRHLLPYLNEIFLDIVYALINKQEIENLSTKHLYHELVTKQNLSVRITEKFRIHQWPLIWSTLAQLRNEPSLHQTWFFIVNDNYPTGDLLYKHVIIQDSKCQICGAEESIQHKLTTCNQVGAIWQEYLTIFGRIIRQPPHSLDFHTLISFPCYKYFPPTKRKFLIWLTATTLYIILDLKYTDSVDLYKNTLLLRFFELSPECRIKMYANYHRAIY